jgi:uncharacterized integral membrane protein
MYPEPTAAHHVSPGTGVRIALAVILVAVLVGLVVDNTDETRIGFVVGDVSAPLFVVVIIAAVVGALAGLLLLHHRRHSS